MPNVKNGDTVKVHYTGKLDDGTVFDSSLEREPLEFKVGEKKVIAGFEDGVLGMAVGESKTVAIPADKGYGLRQEEMVAVVEREKFAPDLELEPGQMFSLDCGNGETMMVTITKIENNMITLDGNHPLAGKNLNFEIKIEEIK